ncbi:MAG TPA: tetratricopeptide repeat protein, partial [Holophagaceae bacterium]|nr:tetratricopeptide repeat protein [Holophagaceae bacterium]
MPFLPPPPPALVSGAQAPMPPQAKAAFDRAYEALRAGRFPEAIAAYEEALALAPDSWDIWLEYTSALRQAGQLQKAARAGWRTVELGPDKVDSWNNLSNVLQMANALPEDAALLEEMARRFPGDPRVVKAFDNLAYTAWSLRDFALARKAL